MLRTVIRYFLLLISYRSRFSKDKKSISKETIVKIEKHSEGFKSSQENGKT